ncbi:CBO0543 family protein [Alkalihalobacillus sp. BA299]|uniref:CBO0543 family protein n=1 Tax=Alkalihalobacillus sp. BA299 TaxID=2815938 RepID=UPI001ADA65DA|nr:CBO0543 family protein [Alkalihalobacillus sp. BA299]
MGNNIHPSHEEIDKVQKKFTELLQEHWIKHDLFGWDWWLLLALTIIPWFIWWKVFDRSRSTAIVLYGLLITLLATFLDIIGWNFHLWSYPHTLIPIYPPMFPADLTIFPVIYMVVYQYFKSWKSFFWAMVVASLIFSFIGEPLMIWLEFYEMNYWKHIYSFPIYIALALGIKWLVDKITL